MYHEEFKAAKAEIEKHGWCQGCAANEQGAICLAHAFVRVTSLQESDRLAEEFLRVTGLKRKYASVPQFNDATVYMNMMRRLDQAIAATAPVAVPLTPHDFTLTS